MASVTYQANYTPQGRMLRLVWGSLTLPMALLWGLIYLGAPIWLAVPALLGAMAFSLARRIHRATFTLGPEGITEELAPYLAGWSGVRGGRRAWRWEDVESWTLEEELTRAATMRKRLTVQFRSPRYRIRLSEVGDEAQRAAYGRFVNAFAARAGGGALPAPDSLPAEVPSELVNAVVPTSPAPGTIPRRPAFFDRPEGQFTGLVLLLGVAAVSGMLLLLGGGLTNWFRFAFILVPGAAWLVWRLFLKR